MFFLTFLQYSSAKYIHTGVREASEKECEGEGEYYIEDNAKTIVSTSLDSHVNININL